MKFLFFLFFILLSTALYAQIDESNFYGTWVSARATYNDGSALPDEHPLKFAYIKYQFSPSGRLNVSTVYYNQGAEHAFEVKKGFLYTEFPGGSIMNTYRMYSLKDTLILIQQGDGGFQDRDAIRFYFVRETAYQNNLKIKPDDVFAIRGADTTYKQCPKIYAKYKGPAFQEYIYKEMADHENMDHRAGHLAATFIVSKTGIADSLKILEGIDEQFNKNFIKCFNHSRKDWVPATLNGKPVSVQMEVDLRYSTSATTIPSYFAGQKANEAYLNKDYQLALYYYDKALETTPTDKEFLPEFDTV